MFTVQYSTIQYSTVQYSTVQHSTVQYSTVQYSTVQYTKKRKTIISFKFYFPVFEPGEENDEEYEKIHEEYKNLVGFIFYFKTILICHFSHSSPWSVGILTVVFRNSVEVRFERFSSSPLLI